MFRRMRVHLSLIDFAPTCRLVRNNCLDLLSLGGPPSLPFCQGRHTFLRELKAPAFHARGIDV